MSTRWDPPKPSAVRIYDVLLGGRDNFDADRKVAGELTRIYPGVPGLARENRAFLARAVGWATGQGIGQFIDLGAGVSVRAPLENIHQTARKTSKAARVCYVDNDPYAARHGRLLLTGDGMTYAEADLRDPEKVLAQTDVTAVIDLAEPACLIFGLV
jgi:hypothetical protein